MRALDELIDTNEPGWALIEEWLKDMKKDGVNIDEYFDSLFKGEKQGFVNFLLFYKF